MDDEFDRMAEMILSKVDSRKVAKLTAGLQKVLSNKEAFEMIASAGILVAIISTEAPIANGKTVLSAIFAVATKMFDAHQAKGGTWEAKPPPRQ